MYVHHMSVWYLSSAEGIRCSVSGVMGGCKLGVGAGNCHLQEWLMHPSRPSSINFKQATEAKSQSLHIIQYIASWAVTFIDNYFLLHKVWPRPDV